MKVICSDCGWIGDDAESLKADHPFSWGDTVTGCPECRGIDTLSGACDEPGCDRVSTCGTPTPGGYRLTCGDHAPEWFGGAKCQASGCNRDASFEVSDATGFRILCAYHYRVGEK